jgi:hypothetical protein
MGSRQVYFFKEYSYVKTLVMALALGFATSPASAATATWQFEGKCEGSDMWNKWHIFGVTSPKDYFIRPWTDEPIIVTGMELLKLRRGEWLKRLLNRDQEWFAVGNTIVPDLTIQLGPGESHSNKALWQKWPSAADAKPVSPIRDPAGNIVAAGGDLLDLHGYCDGGIAEVMLTIEYFPAKEAQ